MLRFLTFAWFNYSVQACPDVKYGKRIHVLPIDDTVEGSIDRVTCVFHVLSLGLCKLNHHNSYNTVLSEKRFSNDILIFFPPTAICLMYT